MNRLPHLSFGVRPLYLQGGSARRLDIDASGRLCISCHEQPERKIPLHHVSRIICSSSLQITANALMACLQSGIPLSILNADGTTLGWCMGSRRKESTFGQLLAHALDDPLWPSLYADWLHSQHLAIAAQVLLMCGVPASASARQYPRVALCNAYFRQYHQRCAEHVDALATLAQHELAALLAREVNDPRHLAGYRPGHNFVEDLGELIGLFAHIDLHHASPLPEPARLGPWAVRRYEKHSVHWQQRFANLMHELEQFLREHW